MNITETIIHALEHDDWNVNRISDTDGTILEIERNTDQTDYDYVGTIDMRDKDADDPDEWVKAAEDCYEAFDPEQEAAIWLDGYGAPSLHDMLDDFDDFKTNTLSRLPDIMRQAAKTTILANRVADRLQHDGWEVAAITTYEGVILEFARIGGDGNEYVGEFDMRDKDAFDPDEWVKAAEIPVDGPVDGELETVLERIPALVREAVTAGKENR